MSLSPVASSASEERAEDILLLTISFEQNMTIDYGQQMALGDTVSKVVTAEVDTGGQGHFD